MKSILLAIFSLCAVFIQAQSYIISGKVVTGRMQTPVEFASIAILDESTGALMAGETTDINGAFQVKVPQENIIVTVSFIGYKNLIVKNILFIDGSADLGVLEIVENSTLIEEVVVRAEKSSTEFKLDKRVFNVGQDLSSSGASALEVLNNVPSVNVDIEGQISLRGSNGVQILINGKPSVIASEGGSALGTITADMIDKIEVITNPSAKYEAEGSSGIINIIIKKEERRGINGSISLNTGWPDNHSLGVSLNRRTEKLNLFTQLGAGYREVPTRTKTALTNKQTSQVIISNGEEYRNEYFYNLILGTDYYLNKYNVFTLSGNVTFEAESQPSQTRFQSSGAGLQDMARWERVEVTSADNPKYQYEFQYKKSFPDHENHFLLFSAIGSFFGKDQNSDFDNNPFEGIIDIPRQTTRTRFQESRHTFNLDFVKPIEKIWTFETGGQYVLNNVRNDFAVEDLINYEFVVNPELTNDFRFTQNVLGLYSTGSYEGKIWGIKLGMRAENTDLRTLLVTTSEKNERNFTNFFPTLHTSLKLTEFFSVQGGYSKRIFRPRLWDLNPFFNIRNNFSVRTGNPNLGPEFTDSYELGTILIREKYSVNAGIFYRYTTETVERITTLRDNINITQPFNLGTNHSTGVEFNGKYTASKWITLTGDFNYNVFRREGSFESRPFNFSADQWSGKLTSKFKFPLDTEFEITGHYQSRQQTVQGIITQNLFADMGLRKKFLKGKAVVNISVRDIFASRIREFTADLPDFFTYNWSQRGRFITFGLSYGFGKGEAMEYSGGRRR